MKIEKSYFDPNHNTNPIL